MSDKDSANPDEHRSMFMCGVCEGFYGKPWTPAQKKELFKRMERFGMNTYLYAPKDDYKHRLYWRDLYTNQEAADLQDLIEAANSCGITFVYAISPGLDITYASPDEVKILSDKLGQVRSLGCEAFAILFDDIDTDLSIEDEREFDSVGAAQCRVTNQVYDNLNQPEIFLFCPTEYCNSRASPELLTSGYLHTLGSELHQNVSILWTVESITDLKRVIKRSPVIWENLHANDYDQTRLYLGAYDGRPPELVDHLRGMLTNPNCEFEMNFVAMHTLSQWRLNTIQHFPLQPGDQDVDMEDSATTTRSYNTKLALVCAVEDWLPEFYKPCGASRCPAKPSTSTDDHIKDTALDNGATMDTAEPKDGEKESELSDSVSTAMDTTANHGKRKKKLMEETDPLGVNDLLMLCDLFSLPMSHGSWAVHLLKHAHWLIDNTDSIKGMQKLPKSEQPPEVCEWYEKALHFHECYRDLALLIDKIVNIPNRDLLYELYFYISDMRSVVSLVNSYIKWHGMGQPLKEPFRGGEQEPWLNRGGLHSEFRRLLPIEGQNDMFPKPNNLTTGNKVFTIRPYLPSDKAEVYMVCRKTWDDGYDSADIFGNHADLIADKSVGGMLSVGPHLCFVLLDEASVCGYVACTTNIKDFHCFLKESWFPEMKEKYPRSLKQKKDQSPAEEVIEAFHEPLKPVSEEVVEKFPGYIQLNVLRHRVHGMTTPAQLIKCAITVLKSHGVPGLHTLLHASHVNQIAFYLKQGFNDVTDDYLPIANSGMLMLAKSI